MSYPNVLFVADLESVDTRRNNLSRSVFRNICKPILYLPSHPTSARYLCHH